MKAQAVPLRAYRPSPLGLQLRRFKRRRQATLGLLGVIALLEAGAGLGLLGVGFVLWNLLAGA